MQTRRMEPIPFTEAELADLEKWALDNLSQQANGPRLLRLVWEVRRLTKRPEGWGDDPLSRFLDDARANVLATAARLPTEWKLLVDLDVAVDVFLERGVQATGRKLVSGPHFVPYLLLHAGHDAYRGAVLLATAGQLRPAYMVMRKSLEHALCAVFTSGNPRRQESWLKRKNAAEARIAVQKEFRPNAMLRRLAAANPDLAKQAEELYKRTTDLEADPNQSEWDGVLDGDEEDLTYQVRLLCLRTAERTGQILLHTIELLFPS
jgi:hypothetical protein